MKVDIFVVSQAIDDVDSIGDGGHKFVVRGESGIGDVLLVEVDGVAQACAVGLIDVALIHSVVFGRGAEVPTVK